MSPAVSFGCTVLRIAVLTLCGCATPSSPLPGTADVACPDRWRSRLILHDLVAALAQLPSLPPAGTRLLMPRPDSRFDQLLAAALAGAGYTVRHTPVEGARRVGYAIHPAPQSSPASGREGVYTFLLGVEAIAVRRAYRWSPTGLVPASSLFVRGDDASGVRPTALPFAHRVCP